MKQTLSEADEKSLQGMDKVYTNVRVTRGTRLNQLRKFSMSCGSFERCPKNWTWSFQDPGGGATRMSWSNCENAPGLLGEE